MPFSQRCTFRTPSLCAARPPCLLLINEMPRRGRRPRSVAALSSLLSGHVLFDVERLRGVLSGAAIPDPTAMVGELGNVDSPLAVVLDLVLSMRV